MVTTRSGTRLAERNDLQISLAVSHPAQVDAAQRIQMLIGFLREATTPQELDDFQKSLFQQVLTAQEYRAEVARNRKRALKDLADQEEPFGGWDSELMVADRLCRQMRAVGDALAWKAFGFDRRPLIALSRNTPVGPLVGKEGLPFELGAVVEAMEQRGEFALLHDLTNTLRIGDVTYFTDDGPKVGEVKGSEASQTGQRASKQRRRLERAIAAINEQGALDPGGSVLAPQTLPLKSRVGELDRVITKAHREGSVFEVLGDELVVSVLSRRGVDVLGDDRTNQEQVLAGLRARAFAQAGLDRVEDHLQSHTIDFADRTATVAPYTVFPFDARTCAELTTDLVSVVVTCSWDLLSRSFERLGWRTACPLPHQHNVPTPDDVLVAWKGNRQLTLHRESVTQLLVELHDFDNFAEAVLGAADEPGQNSAVVTFAEEHRVWR